MTKFLYILIPVVLSIISACSTVAGAVRGAGEDVKSGTDTVSNWIKSTTK
jgi:predicted small secreted protein